MLALMRKDNGFRYDILEVSGDRIQCKLEIRFK